MLSPQISFSLTQMALAAKKYSSVVVETKIIVKLQSNTWQSPHLDSEPAREFDGPNTARPIKEIEEQHTLERTESLRRQWAALVQSSDDAIIGKTPDGTIVTLEPRSENGSSVIRTRRFTGDPSTSFSLLNSPRPCRRSSKESGRREHVKHYETRYGCAPKTRTLVDVSLAISPIKDAADQIVGISTIARDITERKRTERLLNAQHA